mmetsp:Transcript_22014/g.68942  ORF Transcript_22014/g.68942 Transcript_22014/m.68942 type:complete len:257 (-) Transcript_22014:81-851(-)
MPNLCPASREISRHALAARAGRSRVVGPPSTSMRRATHPANDSSVVSACRASPSGTTYGTLPELAFEGVLEVDRLFWLEAGCVPLEEALDCARDDFLEDLELPELLDALEPPESPDPPDSGRDSESATASSASRWRWRLQHQNAPANMRVVCSLPVAIRVSTWSATSWRRAAEASCAWYCCHKSFISMLALTFSILPLALLAPFLGMSCPAWTVLTWSSSARFANPETRERFVARTSSRKSTAPSSARACWQMRWA